MFSNNDEDRHRRSPFEWIMEAIVLFVIACFLLRLGICWLLSVRVPLIVIGIILGTAIVAYRAYCWRKHHDDY